MLCDNLVADFCSSLMFQTVDNERPFILFLGDVEKSLTENTEAFTLIESLIDQLPENVIVIGSHIQRESDNGKASLVASITGCGG